MHSRALRLAAFLVAIALGSATLPAQYSLTVNKDRLINAMNEPQNWLLMNGDYGSLRYSKLTQINRENVKNLRMVWAMALGGMQDVGQNGPENELNPLIDNGFMYTSDGWGTIYKIDARNPGRGSFVWVADPGVQHEGNVTRTRGIALWEDKVIANLPDGRVIAINRDNGEIVWDKKITTKNEFGNQERFLTAPLVADGKVLVQNGAGDGGTRGWVAALDVNTGKELWRWYTVPKPGDPGSETWKDDHNAWKTGGGGIWQTGSYDAAQNLYIVGTGNPFPIYDPQFRPGDNLYTNSVVAIDVATGKMAWYFQYTPNDSWDYDETGVFLLYDTTINGVPRKVVGHFGRNGFFYSIDRTNGRFIKAEKYVNDLNWTKGINPETGQAARLQPEARRADLQPRSARAARRRQEADVPDVARRRGASAAGLQPGEEHRLRRRHRGLLHAERRGGRRRSARTAASTTRRASAASTTATCTTARSPRSTPSTTRCSPRPSPTSRSARAPPRRPAAWCSPRCRTAGSWPTTTRRSRSCGASTSARRSRARRSPTRSDRSSTWPCRPAAATCIR